MRIQQMNVKHPSKQENKIMSSSYNPSAADKRKLISIPGSVYKWGKKGKYIPSLVLTFYIEKKQDIKKCIEKKLHIVEDHNLSGVGASYYGVEVFIKIPLYENNTKAILSAFGKES